MEVDAFAFYLAHELGKTVAEVDAMPHEEYMQWRAYFSARNALEDLRPETKGT